MKLKTKKLSMKIFNIPGNHILFQSLSNSHLQCNPVLNRGCCGGRKHSEHYQHCKFCLKPSLPHIFLSQRRQIFDVQSVIPYSQIINLEFKHAINLMNLHQQKLYPLLFQLHRPYLHTHHKLKDHLHYPLNLILQK